MRPILIFSHVAVMIATIVALEMNHLIVHNTDKSAQTLGTFTAMLVDAQHEFRMSGKPSGLLAGCQQGYLFVINQENPQLEGVLVDYKNRGVECRMEAAPAAPTDVPAT